MAEVATPLYAALDKDKRKKLVWDEAMVTAFEALKQQVANAVALTLPNFNKKFVLVTDASDTGVGAMLANRDNSCGGAKLAPIAFFSIMRYRQNNLGTARPRRSYWPLCWPYANSAYIWVDPLISSLINEHCVG